MYAAPTQFSLIAGASLDLKADPSVPGATISLICNYDVPAEPVVRVADPSVRRVGTRWLTWGAVAACAMMAFVLTQNESPVDVASVPDLVEVLVEAPPTWQLIHGR